MEDSCNFAASRRSASVFRCTRICPDRSQKIRKEHPQNCLHCAELGCSHGAPVQKSKGGTKALESETKWVPKVLAVLVAFVPTERFREGNGSRGTHHIQLSAPNLRDPSDDFAAEKSSSVLVIRTSSQRQSPSRPDNFCGRLIGRVAVKC